MKTILITLLALLTTSSLWASNKLDLQMDTIQNNIIEIQKAGFNNDKKAIRSYSKQLILSLDTIISDIEKPSCSSTTCTKAEHKHVEAFTRKSAKMMKMYAQDLVTSVYTNKMDDAMNDYNQIQKQFFMMSRMHKDS